MRSLESALLSIAPTGDLGIGSTELRVALLAWDEAGISWDGIGSNGDVGL